MVEWMDVVTVFENHGTKTSYQVEEVMHEANYPSFEIWVPVKED
jgi:hypothetical protein